MKRLIAFVLSFGLVAGIVSLSASSASAEDPGQDAVAEDSTVEVEKDGTKFDPKVDKSKLPDGAWYCDMGGVHYARMEEGDGKCELCGMKLKKKGKSEADHGHKDHHH
jgi:hypothetical protein